jgi:hypothetical protein
MRHIHMTHCLMGMGLGVALLLAFGVEAGTVAAVGVALLCPLMMVLCMAHVCTHGGSHQAGQASSNDEATRRAA